MTAGAIKRREMLAGAVALLGAGPAIAARKLEQIEVTAFAGGFNLPMWIADQLGFFEREGVSTKLSFTPDSVTQMRGLLDGQYDVAMTAFDNVVAYREGQGGFRSPNERELGTFMASDDGFLSLIVAPHIRSFADLKGQTLAVDAPTTGYAFVLLEMLARNGLSPGDVTLGRFGGVASRWEALKAGQHVGTLLVAPFDILAEQAGFRRLATATDLLGSYQGVVGSALRSRATARRAAYRGFTRGYRAALLWLHQPRNRARATAILSARLGGMPPAQAAMLFAALARPGGGFSHTGRFDRKGCENVLVLRRRHGGLSGPPQSLERYVFSV